MKKEQLEDLMRRFGDKVLHLAYSYLGDRYLAEDVAQEVFVRVFLSLDQFQGRSSLFTWIYQITVNLCRDYLRSQKRCRLQPSFEMPRFAVNVEDAVLAEIEYQELWQAIFNLPVAYREVIWLHYYDQLELKEIAHILGISLSAVKIRLYRARQHLYKVLQEGENCNEVSRAAGQIASQPAR
ncbi:RNA polymerase sigma-70 factor, ECF subfamily [Thermanaeromonas toyohensis ToBE]|uniref:RNA polymerase sigma factor n=1 Tax=Thermanaeromonas toyohensis ToBE TaxID=698762 RepID=A0A1W1W1B8_9FIRM|nr:sigma-70 family RNA polymerase sigma factor [Thermanaeromonas toyohensis]SMB99366.1 RNA polymerase sigma-70 factor, ECF subfamily [Thermanaeromonas toyohensis ToBE]